MRQEQAVAWSHTRLAAAAVTAMSAALMVSAQPAWAELPVCLCFFKVLQRYGLLDTVKLVKLDVSN